MFICILSIKINKYIKILKTNKTSRKYDEMCLKNLTL